MERLYKFPALDWEGFNLASGGWSCDTCWGGPNCGIRRFLYPIGWAENLPRGLWDLHSGPGNKSRIWPLVFEELDLCEEWSTLWRSYIRGLEYNRISLKEETDTLLWSFGNYVGPLSAALGYDSLIINNLYEEQNRILALLWSLKLPLKIICFTWLLVKDKILT